ncbi:hypothetical protein SM0020_33202 [Sinorhizobium meliloti CCNWSX0020]|uniref:Uncharacterized protein n=1 Tax=Sinorhizobium meliloti CCNWSX0020 TaxID=1107881 RepID=H0GAS9_RHIML|nr:hypothetical protein SM0020_33202 [Sinorhizobium meliloti CCNWSX0020]
MAGGGDELEIERNGLSDAFDFLKEVQGSAEDGRKRAEAASSALAIGLVSRRGMRRKRMSSRIS